MCSGQLGFSGFDIGLFFGQLRFTQAKLRRHYAIYRTPFFSCYFSAGYFFLQCRLGLCQLGLGQAQISLIIILFQSKQYVAFVKETTHHKVVGNLHYPATYLGGNTGFVLGLYVALTGDRKLNMFGVHRLCIN